MEVYHGGRRDSIGFSRDARRRAGAASFAGRPGDITTESTEAVSVESVVRSSRSKGRGRGAASPGGRRVDITTESTESTESRFGGLGRAKRKEAISVESVARSSRSKAGKGGGFPAGRPVDDIDCPSVGGVQSPSPQSSKSRSTGTR